MSEKHHNFNCMLTTNRHADTVVEILVQPNLLQPFLFQGVIIAILLCFTNSEVSPIVVLKFINEFQCKCS